MHNILFVDTDAPFWYDDVSFSSKATGGTIAAIVLLAKELSKYAKVFVVQSNKSEIDTNINNSTNLNFIDYDNFISCLTSTCFKAIIHVRSRPCILDLPCLRNLYPNANIFHWQHITLWDYSWFNRLINRNNNLYINKTVKLINQCHDLSVSIVGTSNFHKKNIANFIKNHTKNINLDIDYVYNPVSEAAHNVQYNKDLLIFFSNPNRGLKIALNHFRIIKKTFPTMKLIVATPGYLKQKDAVQDGVNFAGSLPRKELWDLISQSLAVFYPNMVVPECFGYVYAESNAIGTPLITHDLGAAAEVVSSADQLVDCNDINAIIQTIHLWRSKGRPKVTLKHELMVDEVCREWMNRINIAIHN